MQRRHRLSRTDTVALSKTSFSGDWPNHFGPPCFQAMSSLAAKKQKRTRLTLAEQFEAARMLKSDSNSSVVMRKFVISRLMFTNIKQRYEELITRANNNAISSMQKPLVLERFPR